MNTVRSIQLIPLGTCSANRTKFQEYCAYLLEIYAVTSNTAFEILLDCGSSKILNECDPMKLKAIFITHTHPDHIKYLPKFVRSLQKRGRSELLYIFLHADALKPISFFMKFPFFEIPPFVKFVQLDPLMNFMFEGISVETEAANHSGHCLTYKFTFQLDSEKMEQNSMRICFCPDTSAYSSHLIPFFKNADYVLMDTTFHDKGLEKFMKIGAPITHCSPKYSGPLMQEAGIKTYVAVHYFWKRFGKTYSEALETMRAAIHEFFKGNIIISEDLKPIQLY